MQKKHHLRESYSDLASTRREESILAASTLLPHISKSRHPFHNLISDSERVWFIHLLNDNKTLNFWISNNDWQSHKYNNCLLMSINSKIWQQEWRKNTATTKYRDWSLWHWIPKTKIFNCLQCTGIQFLRRRLVQHLTRSKHYQNSKTLGIPECRSQYLRRYRSWGPKNAGICPGLCIGILLDKSRRVW